MNFDDLLICLALLAILSAPAVYGDPLNPGMLGETMDMPLPPDLVMKAVRAGVITSASEVTGSLPSGSQPMSLGTPSANDLAASQVGAGASDTAVGIGAGAAGVIGAAGATETAGPVNAGPTDSQAQDTETASSLNGTLSLVLQDSATRYLTLDLLQKGDMIMGQGNMTSGGSVQGVAASGLMTGGQLSLTVTPTGGSDLYKLELTPEGNTIKGSYSAQSADGATWSGTAAGILPDILPGNSLMTSAPETSASKTSQPLSLGAAAGGAGASSSTAAMAGPMQLDKSMGGGSSFSSSKSVSMSMNGGGSMISSTSSTSF